MDGLIINDKFNIIGNYNSNFSKHNLKSWVYDLFNNKSTSFSNEEIHQYLSSKKVCIKVYLSVDLLLIVL